MTTNKSSVAEYYQELEVLFTTISSHNGFYNLGWAPRGEEGTFESSQKGMVELVTSQLGLQEGQLVLDVGCGQGAPATWTAKHHRVEVVGVELLQEQLNFALERGKPAEKSTRFVQGDSALLPFCDRCFDGVYSIESAFHYPDKALFLQEASRVLKPGGILAVADLVVDEGKEDHWVHDLYKRALSAPLLYTSGKYRQAALDCGLVPQHAYDLTPGVTRSLTRVVPLLKQNKPQLRKAGYASFYMWSMEKAFACFPRIYPLIPVRYRLFVFRSPD